MGYIRVPIMGNIAVNHFMVMGDARISLELLLLISYNSFELNGKKMPYFVCNPGNDNITLYRGQGELKKLRLEPDLDVLFSFSGRENDLSNSRFINEIFLPEEARDIASNPYNFAHLLYYEHLIPDKTRMTKEKYNRITSLVNNFMSLP